MTLAEQLELKGEERGILLGKAEGTLTGTRRTLEKQIGLKFGALSTATRAALEAADFAQLDTWCERILSAESVEELFAD